MTALVAASSNLHVKSEMRSLAKLCFENLNLTQRCGVVGFHDVAERKLHPELVLRHSALPGGHLLPQLLPSGSRCGDGDAVQVGESGQGVERVLVISAKSGDTKFK